MRSRYDVIVVGARVAGSTVAALLAEAGLSVLVLDRARFPSTTCSTHFFRGGGMETVLARLGVLDEVLALGCPPLLRELLYLDGETVVDGPPDEPGAIGYSLSVRREPLDFILVRRARAAGEVDIAEATSVRDVLWSGDRAVGVELDDGRRIRCEILVGADGRHSMVARRVSPATALEAPAYRAVYYRYAVGFPGPEQGAPDAVEFSVLDDEMAYVLPSDGDRTCLALSVSLETFRWMREDAQARYPERLARHPRLASRLRRAEFDGPLLGCGPERSYLRVPWGPGWALVGDAAMHQDPWSGRGIDMASIHATFLAEAIVDCLRGSIDEQTAFIRYQEQRDAHGLPHYKETTHFAADLRRLADASRRAADGARATTTMGARS